MSGTLGMNRRLIGVREYDMRVLFALVLLACTFGCATDVTTQHAETAGALELETIGFDTPRPDTSVALESVPDDDILELVAWNLGAFEPVRGRRYYELLAAVVEMDPEILAVVEVNFSFVASAFAMDLMDSGACYQRKIVLQSASQDIAIVHKCEVEVTNPRLIPDSDDGNRFLRKALAVSVRSDSFDFVLITVHMKAGRGSSDRNIRTRQAGAIAAWIEDQRAADDERDFMIVGDYNMIPGTLDDETFDALGVNNTIDFVSNEILLNNADAFTHISQSGAPGNFLDGFGVSTDTEELVQDSLIIVQLHDVLGMTLSSYGRRVSDHLPMKAFFSTDQDDD